jgi:hypothetical protein
VNAQRESALQKKPGWPKNVSSHRPPSLPCLRFKGTFAVVGPSREHEKWAAEVTIKDGKIAKVH